VTREVKKIIQVEIQIDLSFAEFIWQWWH